MPTHRDDIVDQFTQQAAPYAAAAPIGDEASLEMLVQWSGVTPGDSVLDVACGPGIVSCALARTARDVTGIDVTSAMIDEARNYAAQQTITNIAWRVGEIPPLPWPDDSFTAVVSRYAFHHFDDPFAVLQEMVRVCSPAGTVTVCDLAPPVVSADAFNTVERLRDPSHVRAFTLSELSDLFAAAGLAEPRIGRYEVELELDSHLARSFPADGSEAEIRRIFAASLADDALGVDARRDGERISYRYPVALLAANR
jgi:ubiquinone/menaquinone biosynthesis C-methylase UbiE